MVDTELINKHHLKDGPGWGWFFVLLFALTLLGGAARFHKLGSPSYWTDEMFQIHAAISGAGPGYVETRWALKWMSLAVESWEADGYATWLHLGLTEWNGRLAAASIGTISVGVLGLLTALAVGRRAGLVFALLLALSTWHIHYSQEARFYVPMFLYYNAALVLYFVASRRGSLLLQGLAMICALLAVSVKPTSMMIFVVIGLDIVGYWLQERRLPHSIRSTSVIVLGAIACIAVALKWAAVSDVTSFSMRGPGQSPLRVVGGAIYLTGLPVCLMAIATIRILWKEARRELIFFGAAATVPIVSFMTLASFMHVEMRYTLVCTYGWLALAAMSASVFVGRSQPKLGIIAAWAPAVIVVATLLLSDLIYFQSAYGNRGRWRDAYEYVGEHRMDGEEVFSYHSWEGMYYLQDNEIQNIRFDFDSLDTVQRDTWFVVKSKDSEFLDGHATLRAAFPTRTPYPQYNILVYLYRVKSPSD